MQLDNSCRSTFGTSISLPDSHDRGRFCHFTSSKLVELTMAEPFGIVAGVVSVSTAFTACVDCFGYIQFGRHFGRDFPTDQLSLNCARLRLTRWGQAVDIYNDPKLGKPEAPATEIQTAKDTLLQILALFADSKDISKKYKIRAKAGDDLTLLPATGVNPTLSALENTMEQLAIKRQKGIHILKLTSWALYRRSQLKDLIESITSLIDNLENFFLHLKPKSPLPDRKLWRCAIANLLGHLETAKAVDSMLGKSAQEALAGHQYLNVGVRGQAQTGDAYSNDWKGNAVGASHTYDGVEVEKDGKALVGNKYGGKDFWDD